MVARLIKNSPFWSLVVFGMMVVGAIFTVWHFSKGVGQLPDVLAQTQTSANPGGEPLHIPLTEAEAGSNGTGGHHGCQNYSVLGADPCPCDTNPPGNTPPSGSGCGDKCSSAGPSNGGGCEGKECQAPTQTSACKNSFIDNLHMNYVHSASDYNGTGSHPLAITLKRYFKSRDAFFESSFGPNQYSQFDTKFKLYFSSYSGGISFPIVMFFDPSINRPFEMTYNVGSTSSGDTQGQGKFRALRESAFGVLDFVSPDETQVYSFGINAPDPNTLPTTTLGRYTRPDGSRLYFEILKTYGIVDNTYGVSSSFQVEGRLIKHIDAAGYGYTIHYQTPVATLANLIETQHNQVTPPPTPIQEAYYEQNPTYNYGDPYYWDEYGNYYDVDWNYFDPNGNPLDPETFLNPPSAPPTTESWVDDFWKIDHISDDFGATLNVAYAPQQVGGQWVISEIGTPSSGTIQYSYQNEKLSQVTLPNSDVSTFTWGFSTTANASTLNIKDASTTDHHQNKTVYLSTVSVPAAVHNYFINSSSSLVKMVVNGNSEVSYLVKPTGYIVIATPTPSSMNVYEGKGNAYKLYYSGNSLITERYLHGTTFSTTAGFAGNTERMQAYAYPTAPSGQLPWTSTRPTQVTEKNGNTFYQQFDKDGFVIRKSYSDNTTEIYRYDDYLDPLNLTNHDIDQRKNLIWYKDREGRVTKYTYDSKGNQTSMETGLAVGPNTTQSATYGAWTPTETQANQALYTTGYEEAYTLGYDHSYAGNWSYYYNRSALYSQNNTYYIQGFNAGYNDGMNEGDNDFYTYLNNIDYAYYDYEYGWYSTPYYQSFDWENGDSNEYDLEYQNYISGFVYSGPTYYQHSYLNGNSIYYHQTYSPPVNLGTTFTVTFETDAPTADHAIYTWEYYPAGHAHQYLRSAAIDPLGNRTDYEYNANHLLAKIIAPPDASGSPRAETLYAYDTAGNLKTITDPEGHVTEHFYDLRGRKIRTLYADGSQTRTIYGTGVDANRVIKSIGRDDVVTAYEYDAAGRLVKTIEAFATADLAGNETPITNPNLRSESVRTYIEGTTLVDSATTRGETKFYSYDHNQKLVQTIVKPNAATQLVSQNKYFGEKLFYSLDPFGRRTFQTYDNQGRMVRTATELYPAKLDAILPLVDVPPPPDTRVQDYIDGYNAAYNNVNNYDDGYYDQGNYNNYDPQSSSTNIWYIQGYSTGYNNAYWEGANDYQNEQTEECEEIYLVYQLDANGNQVLDANNNPITLYLTLQEYETYYNTYNVDHYDSTYNCTYPNAGDFYLDSRGIYAQYNYSPPSPPPPYTAPTPQQYYQRVKDLPRLAANTPNPGYLIQDYIYTGDQLTKTVDPMGLETTYTYDSRGRRTETTVAAGTTLASKTKTIYNAASQVVEVQSPRFFVPNDPHAQYSKTLMTYTGRGKLKSRTQAPGSSVEATESYLYNLAGHLDTRTDVRGFQWKQKDLTCCGKQQVSIDPLGHGSVQNSDAAGRVTHTATLEDILSHTNYADPINAKTLNETTTRYDARGRVTARTTWLTPQAQIDPNNPPIAGLEGIPATAGITTLYKYDDNLTDNLGLDQEYPAAFTNTNLAPGCDGSASFTISPTGEKQLSVQDGTGRTIKSVSLDPANQMRVSTMTYDELVDIPNVGITLQTTSTNELGHTTKSRTNAAGHALQSIDQTGEITTAKYDHEGKVLSTLETTGQGTQYTYDLLGRQLTHIDQEGVTTSKTYDLVGQLLTEIDSKSKHITHTYDPLGRELTVTDRITGVTAFTYDAAGNKLTMTDPENQTTTYAYNELGQNTSMTWPDHVAGSNPGDTGYGITFTAYDPAGRTLRTSDQLGDTVTYIYDLASRLLNREYRLAINSPAGQTESTDTLTYDLSGKVLTVQKGRYDNTVTHTYDGFGRKTGEALTAHGQTYTTSTGYDVLSRVTSMTYPDNTSVSRTYTPRNQLASVSMNNSNIASLEYDAAGREITRTLGNGLVTNMTYRHDHLLTGINNPAVGNYAYTYDTNKNPTSETITGDMSNFGWSNTFDDNDRLINWQRADNLKTQAWDLSPVGNWNSLNDTGVITPHTHGLAHELTSVNGAAVTHDAKGNLTQDERGLQLAWDMDNKLKAAQVPANATWGTPGYHTYEYDGLGRRVAKLVNNSGNLEITMYVSNDQQVLTEYTGSNFSNLTIAKKYTYGEYVDEPLTLTDHRNGANNTFYYHRNRQYSVTALSDATGQITERYTYTPHGEATIFNSTDNIVPTSNIANHTTFTGRDHDQETGLYYFRARMYSPTNGNFISRDPLHYVDGSSVYLGYFATDGVDPSGLANCNKTNGFISILGRGSLKFNGKDSINEPEDNYHLDLFFSFSDENFYDEKNCECCCDRIGFAQIVKYEVFTLDGGHIVQDWQVDNVVPYPYGVSTDTTTPITNNPCKPENYISRIGMFDGPGFNQIFPYYDRGKWEFETCVLCLSGIEGSSQYDITTYECVKWNVEIKRKYGSNFNVIGKATATNVDASLRFYRLVGEEL